MNITIALGSGGAVKEKGVRLGRRKAGLEGETICEAAESGVNPEPNGSEETERGARNRARTMRQRHPGAWALGIESGIMRSGTSWVDVAALVLIEPGGQEWLLWSDAVPLPPEDVAAALARGPHVTIGEIVAERTGCDPHDPHLALTGRSRADFLSEAVEKIFRFALGNTLPSKEIPVNPTTHRVQIGNVVRELELYKTEGPRIALFDLQCDVEVTDEAARCLVYLQHERGIEADAYIMPAGKATPLLQAIGRETGLPLFVAGKKPPYAEEWVEHTYISVTTKGPQTLYISKAKADELRGKKVVVTDDVVSSGGTLDAIKALLAKIGAEVVAVMVVFTEDVPRDDVISLGHLPVWWD